MATLLEAAQAELAETGIRRADIDRETAKQQKILDELAAQRKNKGRGRPSTTHASKVKDAESVRPAVQAIVCQGGLVEAASGLGEASEGEESDEYSGDELDSSHDSGGVLGGGGSGAPGDGRDGDGATGGGALGGGGTSGGGKGSDANGGGGGCCGASAGTPGRRVAPMVAAGSAAKTEEESFAAARLVVGRIRGTYVRELLIY